MSFDRGFLSMMPQTVTWAAFSSLSTDGNGTRTYSTGRSVKARVQQKRQLVRDLTGREVVSQTVVYMAPFDTSDATITTIGPSDKLTLPSGFTATGSTAPRIISVDRVQDATGNHHFRVYL